jgi:hypothetical protein
MPASVAALLVAAAVTVAAIPTIPAIATIVAVVAILILILIRPVEALLPRCRSVLRAGTAGRGLVPARRRRLRLE